jgi:hypothetical protein
MVLQLVLAQRNPPQANLKKNNLYQLPYFFSPEKILQASVNLLEKSLSEVSQSYLQNLWENYNWNRVPYTSKSGILKKHVKL